MQLCHISAVRKPSVEILVKNAGVSSHTGPSVSAAHIYWVVTLSVLESPELLHCYMDNQSRYQSLDSGELRINEISVLGELFL